MTSLYIHWPFCAKKCPYCDYNSHVRAEIAQDAWHGAYLRALAHAQAELPGRQIDTVFFGGGTPSLMPPALVAALLDSLANGWQVSETLEVTLEANPTHTEAARLRAFRDAGVNRVSVGVQALDDTALRFLGRQHSADEALATLALAADLFPRWSADVMYGRPGQTLEDVTRELDRLFAYAPSHVALYQLTIEQGTRFYQLEQQGQLTMPDDETQTQFYQAVRDYCAGRGLIPYEISSAAVPGEECRHNQNYWRYGEYIGIGPGAHGRVEIGGVRSARHDQRSPERWLAQVEAGGHGLADSAPLTVQAQVEEMVILGLRTTEGISRARFQAITGTTIEQWFSVDVLQELQEAGLLRLTPSALCATAQGWQVLNWVENRLLTA